MVNPGVHDTVAGKTETKDGCTKTVERRRLYAVLINYDNHPELVCVDYEMELWVHDQTGLKFPYRYSIVEWKQAHDNHRSAAFPESFQGPATLQNYDLFSSPEAAWDYHIKKAFEVLNDKWRNFNQSCDLVERIRQARAKWEESGCSG